MIELKPPTPLPIDLQYGTRTLFLGGTIDMGQSVDWQASVVNALRHTDWTIMNPRRDHWDASWKQDKNNSPFREQVEWELHALDYATQILMYLAPGSQSPISLMELGLYGGLHDMIVVCPEGFWRKGNVDIVCEYFNIRQVESLDAAIALLS